MRPSKELVIIIFALVALLTVSVFYRRDTSSRSSEAADVKYSSHSTGQQGTKAFYLLLEKLGYNPRRLHMSYHNGIRSEGMVVILAPQMSAIGRTDADRLLEWVRQGNTLLFAPNSPDGFLGLGDPRFLALGDPRDDELAASLKVKLRRGRSLKASIAPSAFSNLTAGIQRLVIRSGSRITTRRPDAVEHFGDDAGGVVISLPEGDGTVIVLSDPDIVANMGLPEGDNLALLVNVLLSYVTDEETVYFDEYHHGFNRRPTILHLLWGTSLGWALIQVAAAVVLLMYSRGKRSVRPKPAVREAHRSSLEYVTSLAGIYQSARAPGVVLPNMYDRLLRSAGRSTPSEDIRELMDECKRKMEDGKISEKELLDLSKRMGLAQLRGRTSPQ